MPPLDGSTLSAAALTILGILVVLLSVKAGIAAQLVRLFTWDKVTAEAQIHLRAESAQENTINALVARIALVEAVNTEVLGKYGALELSNASLLSKYGALEEKYLRDHNKDQERIQRLRRLVTTLLAAHAQFKELLQEAGIGHNLPEIHVDPEDLADLPEDAPHIILPVGHPAAPVQIVSPFVTLPGGEHL